MIAVEAFVGARGTDSVSLVDGPDLPRRFQASGIDFVIQYLGTVTAQGVKDITGAGLAFMPVTYADKFDGPSTVAMVNLLGLPKGCTVWLDLESIGPGLLVPALKERINGWADAVSSAGYMPGLYVGYGAKLTGEELYALRVVRYWHSLSRVPEPLCGYCMHQLYPTTTWEGVPVDVDFVQKDYLGRLPVWVVADEGTAPTDPAPA